MKKSPIFQCLLLSGILLIGCEKEPPLSNLTADLAVRTLRVEAPLQKDTSKDNIKDVDVWQGWNAQKTIYLIVSGPQEKPKNIGVRFALHPHNIKGPLMDLPPADNPELEAVKRLAQSVAGKEASAFVSFEMDYVVSSHPKNFHVPTTVGKMNIEASCAEDNGVEMGLILFEPKD